MFAPRHRPPSLIIPMAVAGSFCGLVYASHAVAIFKSRLIGVNFAGASRLEKCLALVASVQRNGWWGAAYAGLLLAAVAFSVLRRHPRWSTWATLFVLALPWFYYVYACAYVVAAAK